MTQRVEKLLAGRQYDQNRVGKGSSGRTEKRNI